MSIDKSNFKKINAYTWQIPQTFRSDMHMPAIIFASEKMLDDILQDRSMNNLSMSQRSRYRKAALVMPDAH